jgi:predicted small metal-binding protein
VTIRRGSWRAKEEQMAYVINCDCGYVARGETEPDVVDDLNQHMEEVHPDLVGTIAEEDLLAMAEEV